MLSCSGEDYNAHKFLQEYEQPFAARKEPSVLMSNENQDLDQVRANAFARGKALTSSFRHKPSASRSGSSGAESVRLNTSFDEDRSEQLPSLTPRLTSRARQMKRTLVTPASDRWLNYRRASRCVLVTDADGVGRCVFVCHAGRWGGAGAC